MSTDISQYVPGMADGSVGINSPSPITCPGTPTAAATASLFKIGTALSGGNSSANGGTWLSIGAAGSGAGSAADFVNFQGNGSSLFKVDSTGAVTAAGAAATGALTVTGVATASKTIANSAIVAIGNSGSSKTVDFTAGNTQSITATGAPCTLTFTAPAGPARLTLVITQGSGGSKTFTWPAAVKWAGGTAPTLTTTAAHVDIIDLRYDGTNYYGSSILDVS